mgnify:FL=1
MQNVVAKGSVAAVSNPFMEADTRRSRGGVHTIIKYVRRFIHGEEPHEGIYNDAVMALSCVSVADETDVADLVDIFTLRLLHNLGYISPQDVFGEFLTHEDPWSVPEPLPGGAHKAIERALSVSHL